MKLEPLETNSPILSEIHKWYLFRYPKIISGEVVNNLYHKDGKSSEPHTFSEQVDSTKLLEKRPSRLSIKFSPFDVFNWCWLSRCFFRMDEDEGLKHMKWKEALELVSLYFADPQLVLSKYQHWLNQSPFNRSNFFQLRVYGPTV